MWRPRPKFKVSFYLYFCCFWINVTQINFENIQRKIQRIISDNCFQLKSWFNVDARAPSIPLLNFPFKCCMSSLGVVFFLRPFLWGILTFRIVETVCQPFTLFHSKWETKLRYRGQLNHPTARMTKKNIMLYFSPCALGAPASDDLSVFEKKEDMLFFHFIYDSLSFCNGYFTKTSVHKQAYSSMLIHYCVCCNKRKFAYLCPI